MKIEIVELSPDKYAVVYGEDRYHSRLTNRWYTEWQDVNHFCLMSKVEAECLFNFLKRKGYDS